MLFRAIALWSLVTCIAALVCQTAAALPRNTRQVAEGYWLGGAPETVADADDLFRRGVRVVVSAHRISVPVRVRMLALGMRIVDVRFGARFRIGDELLAETAGAEPSELFLHCDHGGDRAGAMLAFLLVLRHAWRPDHAILAVAYPGEGDLDRLTALMETYGLVVTPAEREQYAGIYSGAYNGGSGGLKLRGSGGYETLVRTTLDAFVSHGVVMQESLPEAEPVLLGPPVP